MDASQGGGGRRTGFCASTNDNAARRRLVVAAEQFCCRSLYTPQVIPIRCETAGARRGSLPRSGNAALGREGAGAGYRDPGTGPSQISAVPDARQGPGQAGWISRRTPRPPRTAPACTVFSSAVASASGHAHDVGAAQGDHLAPVAVVHRVDGVQPEPGGQPRGRRRSACRRAGCGRAPWCGPPCRSASRSPWPAARRCRPGGRARTRRARPSASSIVPSLGMRPLGDDDDRRVAGPERGSRCSAQTSVDVERVSGIRITLAPPAMPGVQRDPPGVAAHDLARPAPGGGSRPWCAAGRWPRIAMLTAVSKPNV